MNNILKAVSIWVICFYFLIFVYWLAGVSFENKQIVDYILLLSAFHASIFSILILGMPTTKKGNEK